MSDILKKIDLNSLKRNISLSTDHCLNNSKKASVNADAIAVTIAIPYEHLKSWYDLRAKGILTETFVEILNAFIFQHGIKLSQSDRIEGRLKIICGEINSKRKKLRGRANEEFMQNVKNITIFQDEIVKPAEVEEQVNEKSEKVELLSKENESLKTRYNDLWTEIVKLQESERKTDTILNNKEKEYNTVLDENRELRDYIERSGCLVEVKNTGKEITEVGKRQQDRKLKELKSSVERSLWFAKTFGLILDAATFTDKDGSSYSLAYSSPSGGKSFKDLPEQEKSKIKDILYIVDKFCIGEATYHELTMTATGAALPRSYLIKQCKESLNALTHIERTPGDAEGAQLNFYETLCMEIQKHVSCKIIAIIKGKMPRADGHASI
jgi:hypothetical protein